MKQLRLLVVLFLLPVQVLRAEEAHPTVVTIGAILMLTGDQAAYGVAMREGIELAYEDALASNTFGARRIKLLVEDSRLDPKTAHTAAKKLIEIDHIIAALDASFLEIMANGKLFEQARVPVVTLWDSSQEIEQLGNYVFGIGIWTPSAAEAAAQFSLQTLAAKTAVILSMQNEWSETVAKLFQEQFERGGGKVLRSESLPPATSDFRTSLAKAKNLRPDVFYTPVTENIVPFYTQLRQLGVSAPIVTSDIVAKEHIALAPSVFEGLYQTMPPQPTSPAAEKMLALYREKFQREPSLPLITALGYDGMRLLLKALADGATASEEVKKNLYTVSDFPGASRTISISADGSSPVAEKMFRLTAEKWQEGNRK
jgi:branched-chain amino acid transport system substrate-binding protein